MICPRVAPAARSSPSSRTRSTTVIDMVLKMRNAPANSATAAINAVVAAKSPVDAAIAAAISRGVETTYGSSSSAVSSASTTASSIAPRRKVEIDPGHALGTEQRPRHRQPRDHGASGRATPRTVARQDAADSQVDRRVDALEPEPRADRQSVLGGERRGHQRDRLVRGSEWRTPRERQVMDGRLGRRIDADDRHRRRQRPRPEEAGAEVRAPLERRCRHPRPQAFPRSSPAWQQTGRPPPNAATRRSARPTSVVTARSTAASMPAFVARPA